MSLDAKLLPPLREALLLAEGSGPCFPKLSIPVETVQLLELLSDAELGNI